MAATFKISTSLICEDVRPELGNKCSAMGIYSGDILVKEFPTNIRVAVYANLKFAEPGHYPATARFRLGAYTIATAEMMIEANLDDPSVLILPMGIVSATATSLLVVDLSIAGRWTRIASVQVKLGPDDLFPPAA